MSKEANIHPSEREFPPRRDGTLAEAIERQVEQGSAKIKRGFEKADAFERFIETLGIRGGA